MAFLGAMFDPKKGAGFEAQGTNTNAGVSPEQLAQTYAQAQQGLAGQQGGISQQQAFLQALAGQGGMGNQSGVLAQQQALADQLSQQAQGNGPNPALAQLAQTTGQNMAGQAALMGSQRGAGANPGMMARQIANQGANIQQNSAGQAATMRAQQMLAAQQALQAQQGMMGNLSTQQVGQQAGALGNLNQMLQGHSQAAQGLNAQTQGANQAQNQANVAMQSNMNNSNAGIAAGNERASSGLLGGLLGGAGAAMGMKMAAGGEVPGPGSFAGKFLSGFSSQSKPEEGNELGEGVAKFVGGLGKLATGMPSPSSMPGFSMPQFGSQFSGTAPTLGLGKLSNGGAVGMKQGGKVPGTAKVSGDDLKNDTVPAMLSPKEIVIPRSITMGDDAPNKAAAFVAAILAKQRMKK